MNKLIALVISLSLVAGLLAGCAGQLPKEYDDPSQEIEIGVGEQFILALDSNPTTGYNWEADFELRTKI